MRTTTTRALLGAGLSGVLALTGAITTTSSATAETAATSTATEEPGELLLMLDASGSMKEPDPAGGAKMEAAKKALTGVVESLPTDTHVGLRVYGATEPGGTPTKAACADTQLAVPIGPLDKPALTSAIKGFQAKGETPIAHSLTKAMDDLGDTGKRNIILVSDGEESCVPDPCPVVKDLVQNGVDLRIDTVGFGVKDTAREQLQCIADAGGGTYYDATNADELTTSLNKLSTRALREFTVEGTPITMTEDKADAPAVAPGRYTDKFTVSDKPRYARIERTPNSIVHLALVARPPFKDRDDHDMEAWDMAVYTPDGENCARNWDTSVAMSRNGEALTAATSVNNEPTDASTDSDCATSEELLLEITYDEGAGEDTPLQLVYIEEPAATNVDSLPEPVSAETVTGWMAESDDSTESVVGGGGFADAATLTPGSYTDTILPGEQLYYRVRVDYGQNAAFTTSIEGAPIVEAMESASDSQFFSVKAWSPTLYDLTRLGGDNPRNRKPVSNLSPRLALGEFIPEVRYRNKEVGPRETSYRGISHVSVAGYYYFSVSREPAGDELSAPVNVRVDVDVKGEPTGKPQFVNASASGGEDAEDGNESPTAEASTSAADGPGEDTAAADKSPDEGGSPLPWIGGGLLAAITLGAGAWFGIRRLSSKGDN